ncbi:chromosome (plasmid) partitioning protein ParA [Vibrio ponticus]|nr:chromosome (plasmid) partitioning protein ParA [Vibrio ponticus]
MEMNEKQLRTWSQLDEISVAALQLIVTEDEINPKFERTFTQKEATEYLKCDSRTLKRHISELDIKVAKYGVDFILTLEEVYRIRDALAPTTTLKKQVTPFKRSPKQKCQKIVISNQKGGVGKTVTTITLGSGLAVEYHQGYRICIIDMDGQSTLSMYQPNLDTSGRRATIGDLLIASIEGKMNENEFSEYVKASVADTTIPNLKILPADQKDRELEAIFHKAVFAGQLTNPYDRLSQILEVIEDDFDIIIIDTPPSYGYASLNAYHAGSSIIFPLSANQNDLDATCNYFAYLPKMYTSLLECGHHGYDFIKVLVTNYEETSSCLDIQDKLTQHFSSYVLGESFKKSEAVRKCARAKNSVFDLSPSTYDGHKGTLKTAALNARAVISKVHTEISNTWKKQLEG